MINGGMVGGGCGGGKACIDRRVVSENGRGSGDSTRRRGFTQ